MSRLGDPGYLWVGKKGDLDVYVTHAAMPQFAADGRQLVDQDGAPIAGEEEPCIYISNENRAGKGGIGHPAVLVPFVEFWAFRPEDRDRPKFWGYHVMQAELSNMCAVLYGIDYGEGRHRIHDALLEFADDIKNVRPPPQMTQAQFLAQLQRHRVRLTVNGERII